MTSSNENSNLLGTRPDSNLGQDEPQIHVSGIFIVLLEVALIIENALPILVVITYLPSCARGVGDRLIAALSVTCILSALIPTPLGLASYFTGSWYGGSPTCSTYQVTSTWCNLSALALLSYICVNCHFAVSRLLHFRTQAHIVNHSCRQNKNVLCESTPEVQRSPHPSTNDRQESNGNHRDERYENPSADQSIMIRIKDHDNEMTKCNADAIHANFDKGGVAPGTSVSSFECSKLEFLAENGQENNLGHVYDKLKDTTGVDRVVVENSDIQMEYRGQEQKTDSCGQLSESLDAHHPTSGGIQDSSLTEKYDTVGPSHSHESTFSNGVDLHNHCDMNLTANSLVYENSTFLYSSQMDRNNKSNICEESNHQKIIQNADLPVESRLFRAKDYISIALFFLYSVTLTISSLPVVGFGPQHDPTSKLCRSWLVPTPKPQKERVFFIAFLTSVYVFMLIGCLTAGRVGYLVSKRVKQEMRRTTRLYHEEEDVPDIRELSVLDDLKRHHSLSCLAMCGILTWLPIAIMLTLQKSGVHISEATLVYSNIATSLPCLLNPLLYSLVLARYREGYKAILERCRRKKGPQKPHQLRNVQRCCEHDPGTDNGIISSSDGHRCVHGHPNPTFDSCSYDEDILDDDEEDEENNDLVEDFDQYFNSEETKYKLFGAKLSEKTPLHFSNSAGKLTKSSEVRNSGLLQNKRRLFPTNQSNDDEKCLLSNEFVVKQENETKL